MRSAGEEEVKDVRACCAKEVIGRRCDMRSAALPVVFVCVCRV